MSNTAALKHNDVRIHGPVIAALCQASLSNLGASFVSDGHGFASITRTSAGIYGFTLPADSTDVKLFCEVEGTATTTTYQVSRAGRVITVNIRTSGTLADPASTLFHMLVIRRREY